MRNEIWVARPPIKLLGAKVFTLVLGPASIAALLYGTFGAAEPVQPHNLAFAAGAAGFALHLRLSDSLDRDSSETYGPLLLLLAVLAMSLSAILAVLVIWHGPSPFQEPTLKFCIATAGFGGTLLHLWIKHRRR